MANPPSSSSFDWKMYRYTPSLALAAVFLCLFSTLTLLHVYAYTRHRRTSVIYIILGGLCEIAGFGARMGSHFDNEAWAPFIIQGTLLLIGPLFFAATVYIMLGRTIRLAGAASVSRITPRWYTRIFVTADVSTLIIQGLGAGIMGTMQLALALAGEKIVIAGLALQVTTFVVFLAAAIDFHIRMSKTSKTSLDSEDIAWRKMIRILYTVSTLILFRCAFRLIEYSMGNAAYLISHEWTLYVFDGMPMFVVLVLFFVFQPAELNAPQESKERDSSDGETGIAGA